MGDNIKVGVYKVSVDVDIKGMLEQLLPPMVKQVADKSPRKRGKYRRGWQYTIKDGKIGYIHNSKYYRLTHLLEDGHRTRKKGGGKGKRRTKPQPHLRPVYEANYQKIITAFKNIKINARSSK